MSNIIKLTKGFDIKLKGPADRKLASVGLSETFAVKPTDFPGLGRPKLLVQEGDSVKAGSVIYHDKKDPRVQVTSPVSGEIAAIIRGEKRKLLEIRILADKQIGFKDFNKYSPSDIQNLSREDAAKQMLDSGAWVNIIQRPYAIVANPDQTPKSIFISGFDSNPLAPDYGFTLKGQETHFQAGINILRKFTKGSVHLNIYSRAEIAPIFANAQGVQLNKFDGPHPAGNVGVQIHHLDPINKGEVVWTVSPWAVSLIGKLFLEGKYDASKVIAVAGSEVKTPQYYTTYAGSCINKFIDNNLNSSNVRFISGSVLHGERIPQDGYLGYYSNLLSVIPEGDYQEFLGWILPSTKKISFQRAIGLLSFLNPSGKEYVVDSNTHGEERTFVQTGVFEKLLPMDIYPLQLLKAILAKDYNEMEALGIYEVADEDFSLCEFADVSKNDIQNIIREGIDLMINA